MSTQFIAIDQVNSVITVTLILNLSTVVVLILGVPLLQEYPTVTQVFLIFLSVVGVLLYFHPISLLEENPIGLFFSILTMLANSGSMILGRKIGKEKKTSPLVVTVISMFIGSLFLFLGGLILEGFPTSLSPIMVIFILWLSIMNTALAFTLWNHSLRIIRAVDMTLINNLMLPEIVVLAIIFLSDSPSLLDWLGLAIVVISTTLIQYLETKRKKAKQVKTNPPQILKEEAQLEK